MNRKFVNDQIKRTITLVLALVIVAAMLGASTSGSARLSSFIVQGANLDRVAALIDSYGGKVTSRLPAINGVGALLPNSVVSQLQGAAGITRITPNESVQVTDLEKHDPVPETDYADVVGADQAWQQGTNGSGVTVAVVDTGFSRHPGLMLSINGRVKDRILGWVDFVDGSRAPKDPNGHGTHIAGIIANSEIGADGEWNGVAPGVQLVGVRVLDEKGMGNYEGVIQGIQWVIDHREEYNIKVMNLSLVSQVQSPYWADPLNLAVMKAWEQGITVVVAAGNSGPGAMTVGVPGNNPYAITVGAFTDNYTPMDWRDDYITPFSAAGPTLDGFTKPDLVAPGAHVVSTTSNSSYVVKEHRSNWVSPHYFSMSGTSQAAAVVSGVAALALSHNSDLSPNQVKYQLMYTAFPWVNLDQTSTVYSIWQQGAGRVNAPGAVYAEPDGVANQGMDILADLNGDEPGTHYQGYSYFDGDANLFRLVGDFFSGWTSGYGVWAGDYGPWTGSYGAWVGGTGAWAGSYGVWAGSNGVWAGSYGVWAGGIGAWAGGYGVWAGGHGAWAGGYGAWAGSYGEADFAQRFTNWYDTSHDWEEFFPGVGAWIDYED